MQVVYICAELYQISTGTPASRGPSAIAGLLVVTSVQYCIVSYYYVVCTVMARDVAVAGVSRGPGSLSCTVSLTVAVTVAVVVVFAAVALVIIFFKLVVPSL